MSLTTTKTVNRLSFLTLTLILPVAVVLGNFAIGSRTPITYWLEDDMAFVDAVWRLVQGQRLGTDFHHIVGFGGSQVAALLWRLFGPDYRVIRASADIFALLIVICSWVVVTKRLRASPGLATLFCLGIAWQASSPSIFGMTDQFGTGGYYNRLISAALAVLFVQQFACSEGMSGRRTGINLLITAFLLNLLFLAKISGLVVGLAIVLSSLVLCQRREGLLGEVGSVLLLFFAMAAIDFAVADVSVVSIVDEYVLAAQARIERTSPTDILHLASSPVMLGSVVCLTIYALWGARVGGARGQWKGVGIVALFWSFQVLLNKSNATANPSSIVDLAPAAAVALSTWMRRDAQDLRRLTIMALLPTAICILTIVPKGLASVRALQLAHAVSSGNVRPTIVTAGTGIRFVVLIRNPEYAEMVSSLTHAIDVIDSLGERRSTIANLDFVNPFPALFLTPSAKGLSSSWDFIDRPAKYEPTWQEILGDACLVAQPATSIMGEDYPGRLFQIVQPQLALAFDVIYEDASWKFWKRRSGCGGLG